MQEAACPLVATVQSITLIFTHQALGLEVVVEALLDGVQLVVRVHEGLQEAGASGHRQHRRVVERLLHVIAPRVVHRLKQTSLS